MFGNKNNDTGYTVQPIQSQQDTQGSVWQIVLVIFAGLWLFSTFTDEDPPQTCAGVVANGTCAPVPSLPQTQ